MDVGMLRLDPHYRRVVHVIVMVVRNHYRVNGWNILYLAGHFCVTLRSEPSEWTAPLAKHRIEKYS